MSERELADIDLHADLARVLDDWHERYLKAGKVPAFHDIDLMDFYDVADRMIVADRHGGIPDETYYWRFAGSTLRDIWGMELTGKYLHETHDAETTAASVDIYREMTVDQQPHYWARPAGVIHEDRSYIYYERVVMPLANCAGELAHFMGVYVFFRRSARPADLSAADRVVRISLPERTGP